MAPSAKTPEGRRKSGGKPTLIVTLTLKSSLLRDAIGKKAIKSESPAAAATEHKDTSDTKESPSTPAPVANSNGEPASDSNAATPAADGTPVPSVMGPPTEGKKKGVKRNADSQPRLRGKPGPKKKPRLEDGTIDHAAVRANAASRLGPKANQGAINAGLRALDRSGKPCRKWAKGSFTLKSFTGVVWGINRWTAPPKTNGIEGGDSEVTPLADSTESSNKENKDNNQQNGDASVSNSNAGGDMTSRVNGLVNGHVNGHVHGDNEMQSIPSVNASSPAPVAVAAAS